jgi:hypothetical protein
MLKSKFSLSRHFEYANEQITYHFWLCVGWLVQSIHISLIILLHVTGFCFASRCILNSVFLIFCQKWGGEQKHSGGNCYLTDHGFAINPLPHPLSPLPHFWQKSKKKLKLALKLKNTTLIFYFSTAISKLPI